MLQDSGLDTNDAVALPKRLLEAMAATAKEEAAAAEKIISKYLIGLFFLK